MPMCRRTPTTAPGLRERPKRALVSAGWLTSVLRLARVDVPSRPLSGASRAREIVRLSSRYEPGSHVSFSRRSRRGKLRTAVAESATGGLTRRRAMRCGARLGYANVEPFDQGQRTPGSEGYGASRPRGVIATVRVSLAEARRLYTSMAMRDRTYGDAAGSSGKHGVFPLGTWQPLPAEPRR